MIVGLIGPAGVVERARDIIINERPNAIIKNFIYENYKETIAIVNKVQNSVDGIIFFRKNSLYVC